ncbi:MAG: MFS transporter [Eubacterium sp.]|nr:MFS transporter [Eubacterium sp.]
MANEKISYKEVLKESGYRKLLLSTIINRFGDSVDAIAFTWLVYQVTQSGAWSAIIFGLNILPNVVIQPFAGAAVEKLDKRKVMVFTHILRGIVLLGFLIIYLSGRTTGWLMAAFTVVVTSIEAFNMPSGTAFIPKVIKKEHLTYALSLNATLSNAVTLVGTGAAGVIIAKAGIFTAMIIDIVTFFGAALIIFTIRANEQIEEENSSDSVEGSKSESYLATMKEGLRYIRSQRVIVNYCLVGVMLNLFLVPINALQAPLVSECYHMGSELLSVIGMTLSFGSILGSAVIPLIDRHFSVKKTIISFGILLGLGVLILPLGSMFGSLTVLKYGYVVFCFALMTFSAAIINGVVNIRFIGSVDQRYLARSSAVFVSFATAAMPLGSMLVSWAELRIHTATLIRIGGLTTIIFFIILAVVSPQLEVQEGKVNEVKIA